ncbi:hypothetical protein XELAEV_18041550mg [Xenopus laevis]|uniref:Zinc finger CCHC domain-containing protein n=1 Tax=Xenopus laevis TaxID=8355 RepID=A0A974C3L6_XENLA|nr:hypothetical protein XELAEV_18041550mg [Xenopus laevis]
MAKTIAHQVAECVLEANSDRSEMLMHGLIEGQSAYLNKDFEDVDQQIKVILYIIEPWKELYYNQKQFDQMKSGGGNVAVERLVKISHLLKENVVCEISEQTREAKVVLVRENISTPFSREIVSASLKEAEGSSAPSKQMNDSSYTKQPGVNFPHNISPQPQTSVSKQCGELSSNRFGSSLSSKKSNNPSNQLDNPSIQSDNPSKNHVSNCLKEEFWRRYNLTKTVKEWADFRTTPISKPEFKILSPLVKIYYEEGFWVGGYKVQVKLKSEGYLQGYLPTCFFIDKDRGVCCYIMGHPRLCFKCGARTHLFKTSVCRDPQIKCNLCQNVGHACRNCPEACRNIKKIMLKHRRTVKGKYGGKCPRRINASGRAGKSWGEVVEESEEIERIEKEEEREKRKNQMQDTSRKKDQDEVTKPGIRKKAPALRPLGATSKGLESNMLLTSYWLGTTALDEEEMQLNLGPRVQVKRFGEEKDALGRKKN